jgi:hypothetical protein
MSIEEHLTKYDKALITVLRSHAEQLTLLNELIIDLTHHLSALTARVEALEELDA